MTTTKPSRHPPQRHEPAGGPAGDEEDVTEPGDLTGQIDTADSESMPFEDRLVDAQGHTRPLVQPGVAAGDTQLLEPGPGLPELPVLRDMEEPLEPQVRIGRYVLERPLGAGGLGTVWSAYDTVLTRKVAVKTLPLAVATATPGQREQLVARVLDEARAAARLSHPHIVTVHDAGVSAEGAYIAMELLRGRDLSQMLRGGWRPRAEQAALIVRRVADALSYAHSKGVIHRDIKPANIFMVGRTRPVVLDFGIAQLLHPTEATGGPALGSPFYAAPEQFDGRECDPRTDVYSLGVVLYELITGRRPYLGSSLQEIRASVRAANPVPPSEIDPGVSPELAAIAMRAISISPDNRHRTAGTMARELRAWLATQPVSAEPAPLPGIMADPMATSQPLNGGAARTPVPLLQATSALDHRPRAILAALSIGVAALLLLVAWLLWSRG